MPAKTKAELLAEKKPKGKSKPTKKKTLTSLYKKASKAMQDYYRITPAFCKGGCGGLANLKHHHSHWGQSVALRFEPLNLVSLCSGCHFAFHQGSFKVKVNYERNMAHEWGEDWEDQLVMLERSHVHQTEKEKREYLAELITKYQIGID